MKRPPEVTASVRQVVEVEFLRGAGVEGDPYRRVHAYYDFDGTLLAEADPVQSPEEPLGKYHRAFLDR